MQLIRSARSTSPGIGRGFGRSCEYAVRHLSEIPPTYSRSVVPQNVEGEGSRSGSRVTTLMPMTGVGEDTGTGSIARVSEKTTAVHRDLLAHI